jgi:hypothetical protein
VEEGSGRGSVQRGGNVGGIFRVCCGTDVCCVQSRSHQWRLSKRSGGGVR